MPTRPVTRAARRLGSAVRRVVGGRGRGGPPVPPPGPAPARLGREGGTIHIDYAPTMDGDADPGEVVWGWVPYEEDPTKGKDRPLVVVGHRHHALVAVPLTSKRDRRDLQVAVGTGAWDRKRRPSYARIDRLLDLDPATVRREGAVLAREHFDAVVDAVATLYDVDRG